MPRDTEAVLEPHHRPLIEAEQVAGILVKASLAKIAVEPVSELEVRSTDGKPQRVRQIENAEVRLGEHQVRIVVVAGHGA